MTYNAAIAEIQQILAEIEHNRADLDTLGAKIKRATELIAFCRDKLTKADAEVENMLRGAE